MARTKLIYISRDNISFVKSKFKITKNIKIKNTIQNVFITIIIIHEAN